MPPLYTPEPVQIKGFIRVTRVYVQKAQDLGEADEIKTQPVQISIDKIESYRPRNTIGTKETGNRTTLVLTSGKYVNVKEKFSEIGRLLNRA